MSQLLFWEKISELEADVRLNHRVVTKWLVYGPRLGACPEETLLSFF